MHGKLKVLLGAALMSVTLLTACTSGATTNNSSPGASASSNKVNDVKNAKIGFVAVNLNSPSITRIKDSFTAAAQARGWTVETFDGQGDQNATNNAAMNFIQRGFNAIVNDSSPNEQMSGVIDAAAAKKVPFVSIYGGSVPNISAEVGTNETVNGALITQEMVNAMGGNGRVLKLNWTGLQALRDRDNGFHAVLQGAKGVQVAREIEIKVPGQVDDAYAQTTNFLQSDKNIQAIWVGFDELAPPVVRAVEQAGLKDKIKVYGFDGNPFAWDLIRSGSPYKMEPANPFEPMGTKAVDTLATLLGGGTLPSKVIYMKPCLINQQTVPTPGKFPDWNTCPYFPGSIGS